MSLSKGPRTVVVAGDDARQPARVLARDAGWPLLAEPSSGSRNGEALVAYRLLLAHSPLADQIERVVSFGHATLSRPVTALLARTDIEIVHVGDQSTFPVPAGPNVTFADQVASRPARDDAAWLAAWRDADAGGHRRGRRPARRHDALRRRPGRQPGRAAGRAAVRRLVQPDPRPRPRRASLPGGREAADHRQPWSRRHRRLAVDRDRGRARPSVDQGDRLRRRPDLPARQQRPADRPGRAAAGPDDRRRVRRRRQHLRDARAGRTAVRRRRSSGSSRHRPAPISARCARGTA